MADEAATRARSARDCGGRGWGAEARLWVDFERSRFATTVVMLPMIPAWMVAVVTCQQRET